MSPTAKSLIKPVSESTNASTEDPKEKASTMLDVRERLPKRSSIARSSFLNENSIRTLLQDFSNRHLETSYIPPSTAFVAATNPRKLKAGSFAVVPQASTTLSFMYSPTEGPHHDGTARSLNPAFEALCGFQAAQGGSFSQSADTENNSVTKIVHSPMAAGSHSRKHSFLLPDADASGPNSNVRPAATRKPSFLNSSAPGQSSAFNGSGNNRAFKSALGLKIELYSPPAEESPTADRVVDLHNFGAGDSPQRWAMPQDRQAPEDDNFNINHDGTIFVDGMTLAIGTHGIIRPDETPEAPQPPGRLQRMHMRERLVVLSKLGQGASSIVYKALDLTDMKLVALKMIHVNERAKRSQLVKEVCALFQHIKKAQAKGPERFIVDFYDAFSNPEDGIVLLMLEYIDGGSLQDIVDGGGCHDEAAIASICFQAFSGLSHLHSCCQLHRDLKPGNLLISHRGEVKIADLGILKQLDASSDPGSQDNSEAFSLRDSISAAGPNLRASLAPQTAPRRKNQASTTTFVGTATYMSPERIDGKEYSYPADVWAMGLTILAVAMGRFPLESAPQGHSYWSLLHKIRDSPPPSLPADGPFHKDMRDFLDLCLRTKPEERSSCRQLLRHKFLEQAAKAVDREDVLSRSRDDHLDSIAELQAIMQAVLAHTRLLVTTKKHLLHIQGQGRSPHNNNASEAPQRSHHPHHLSRRQSQSAPQPFSSLDKDSLDSLFGESILTLSPVLLLQKALFGAVTAPSPAQTFRLAPASLPLARARLSTLAHQLYMPLDMLLDEAQVQYGGLLREEFFSSRDSDLCMELDDAL
eukprot:CAMPEP_0170084652 /NCGR_PEP_ID=MMETSP0019_2-20121128/19783_1 /TAXON_ID=98059 /ORGANISM="Dinobryon sp., Strain UTEXLB2267" /LENGTH=808 /DNA_ID=CAMNT_0010300823 /DNA_START=372 /DNA_END=2798 /DNA_ORIENTATION=-